MKKEEKLIVLDMDEVKEEERKRKREGNCLSTKTTYIE